MECPTWKDLKSICVFGKKNTRKKKKNGSGYCANPQGPVASFEGLCKIAAAPFLLAALQAASR